MTPEQKELLYTGRWMVRDRFTAPKTREDLLMIFDKLIDGETAAPLTPSVITPVTTRRKIAVVVGHNPSAPGAFAPHPINASEFHFNTAVARVMEQAQDPKFEVKMFQRLAGSSYTREISEVYGRVDAWGADASVELHFNAAGPGATGTETLIATSEPSRNLGKHVQAAMLEFLDLKTRGLKLVTRQDRGGWSLYAGKAPAILTEPFFASNEDDVEAAAKLGIDGFARMYLEGIRTYVSSLK